MSVQKSKIKNKTQNRPINKINKQREIEQRKRKKRKTKLIIMLMTIIIVCIIAYISTSPTLKIKKISIKGNEQLTKEKVQEIAGIKTGDNIFFKIGKVLEAKLEQNGCVEEAKVRKIYPNTVEIELTERKKQFQIKTETENYIYIDEQGYIVGNSTEKLGVPTIIGMSIKETEINSIKRLEEKDLEKMENILQILDECKKIEIVDKITEINVESEYLVKLENEGIIINLGDSYDLKNKMYYVSAILKQEKENQGTIYVNGNLNEGFLPYFSAK